jgi:hypothetical protein
MTVSREHRAKKAVVIFSRPRRDIAKARDSRAEPTGKPAALTAGYFPQCQRDFNGKSLMRCINFTDRTRKLQFFVSG